MECPLRHRRAHIVALSCATNKFATNGDFGRFDRPADGEGRLSRVQDPVSWTSYLLNADFWSRTLQNWQSEFLAVGSMVVLSVYLRQRGSPDSKPVGEPHTSTGVEG